MVIIGLSGLVENQYGEKTSIGAGKDTVADILVEKCNFVKISLADPIKRILREIWDFEHNYLWGPSEYRNSPDSRYIRTDYLDVFNQKSSVDLSREQVKNKLDYPYLTVRYAAQVLGTDVCRKIDKDAWVRLCLNNIEKILKSNYAYSMEKGVWFDGLLSEYQGAVITDVRFFNEFEYIKNYSEIPTVLVRIKRNIVDESRKGEQLELFKETKNQHESETEVVSMSDSAFDYIIENNSDFAALEACVQNVRYKVFERCVWHV